LIANFTALVPSTADARRARVHRDVHRFDRPALAARHRDRDALSEPLSTGYPVVVQRDVGCGEAIGAEFLDRETTRSAFE